MEALDEAAAVPQPAATNPAVEAETWVEPGVGYYRVKRALDVLVSATALAALSPLWLLLALVIKLTSRGPVLYRTTTLGLNARPFTLYKFRTMMVDSNEGVHREWIGEYVRQDRPFAVEEDANGERQAIYKVVNDPRVTAFGRHLRRTGLDEAPQFINVLRAEMSIVGPRSPRPFEYEHYNEWAKQRVKVIPGITGLYQVTARSTASFSEMVALDLEYARRRSIRLDLWIMARTIPVMLFCKGGY